MLEGCGGLERNWFFTSFYVGRVWWSWKNWIFLQFLLWKSVVVLKELLFNSFYFNWLNGLIFYSFYFERVWWSWKNWFLTVSTLGGFGGLERTDLFTIHFLGGCGGPERTDFYIYIIDSMELIFYSFYFERVWWSWKNWFYLEFLLCEECGGLERTDF